MQVTCWIQSADLSSEDLGSVDVEGALAAFEDHDWSNESQLLVERENTGQECCPPGLGLVADDRRILHICPENDDTALVHYHYVEVKRILGLFPLSREKTISVSGINIGLLPAVIHLYFDDEHDRLLNSLSAS